MCNWKEYAMGKMGNHENTPHDKRVDDMREFIQHLTAYAIVIGSLMVLNVVTGPEHLWFLWVAFFWGIGLAFHTVDVFMGDSSNIAKRIVKRMECNGDTVKSEASPPRPTVTAPERAPSTSEINSIIRDGQVVVDVMRKDVRTLPQNRARRDAMLMVSKADEILLAIEEQPGEVLLARDFLNGLLKPIGKLLGDYSRLAVRDIPSAQKTLREVEEKDFPALIKRLDAVYDRLHRGNLIDLEVAREMMALDTPIQGSRTE